MTDLSEVGSILGFESPDIGAGTSEISAPPPVTPEPAANSLGEVQQILNGELGTENYGKVSEDRDENIFRNFSNGLASTLGLVGDVATEALNLTVGAPLKLASSLEDATGMDTGLPDELIPNKFGERGVKIQSELADVGMATEVGKEGRSGAARSAYFLGEMAVPYAGQAKKAMTISKALKSGKEVPKTLLNKMGETIAKNPKKAVAYEAGSITGMGYAGAYARENLGMQDEFSVALAELTGGFAPSIPKMLTTGTRFVGSKGYQYINSIVGKGAKVRAARRVQELPEDKPLLLGKLSGSDTAAGIKLNTAAKTRDTNMLSLQRAIFNQNHEARGDAFRLMRPEIERLKEMARYNVTHADDIAEASQDAPSLLDAKAQVKHARVAINDLVDTRLNQANAELNDKIGKMMNESGFLPDAAKKNASIEARAVLGKALEDVRKQESELWEAVDDSVIGTIQNAKNEYGKLIRSWNVRSQGDFDMPDNIKKIFGSVDSEGKAVFGSLFDYKKATAKQIQNARRVVQSAWRAEKDQNKLRLLNQLSDALYQDLKTAHGKGGGAHEFAMQFSRDLNARFTKGTMGRVLGQGSRADTVPAEDTLTIIAGGRGQTRDLDQMLNASKDTRPMAEQFLLASYLQSVPVNQLTRGEDAAGAMAKVDPAAHHRFMMKNSAMLERFPQLRERIMDIANNADELKKIQGQKTEALSNPYFGSKGRASLFADAAIDQEVDEIFSQKGNISPKKLMSVLASTMKKDKSGRALEGLRNGVGDYMTKKFSKTLKTSTGENILTVNADNMRAFMNKPANRDALKVVYSSKQLENLERIVNTFDGINMALGKKGGDTIPVMGDLTGKFVMGLASWMGAKAGSTFNAGGSGSIVIAGRAAALGRDIVSKFSQRINKAPQLIAEAIADPQIMEDLMTSTTDYKKAEAAYNRLRIWLMAVPADQVTESSRQEQTSTQGH